MTMSDTSNGGVYDSVVSYHPRLCHLTKWDDFNGYGFNLHAEKGKAGQYIGKVDEGSPAVAAQLKQGDRIVEVNGVNIGNENHQQVVQRIKAGGEETKLLVVDAETDLYFKEKKIVVRGEMEEVIYCKTPPSSDCLASEEPVHVNSNHTEAENLNHNEETGEMTQGITKVVVDDDDDDDAVDSVPVVVNGVKEDEPTPEPVEEIKENGIYDTVVATEYVVEEVTPVAEIPPEVAAPEPEIEVAAPEPEPEVVAPEIVAVPVVPEPEPEPIPEPEPVAPVPVPEPEPVVVVPTPEPIAEAPPTPEPQTKTDDLLDFGNVSVEEMKKRIQSKKKVDTRFSQMGLREKYDLLQRL